jgi:hypothetical protein
MSGTCLPRRTLVRRFTLGSGPLKRTTDRLQVLSRLVLLVVVLGSVPLAVAVGITVSSGLHATAAAQAAARHEVAATLLADAPVAGYVTAGEIRTAATWAVPGGGSRDGDVIAPAGARAGQVVQIWLDRTGAPTTEPLSDADIAVDTAVGVDVSLLGLLAVAGTLHLAVVWLLDRHRARRWAAEWAAIEPLWGAGSRG